jgi:excisionase family DNA binding protein
MTMNWLTRQDAAKYLSIHPRTLDRWVEEGRVVRYHVDGIRSVRFKVAELDELMKPEPALAA